MPDSSPGAVAAPGNLSDLHRLVADRLGVLPNFFCTAALVPGLIDRLWDFAKSSYFDNPLPSLFKERLFVHLSRFCEVRYCIIRHVGFLVGQGNPAGDPNCPPQNIEQVVALLRRPVPSEAEFVKALQRLQAAPFRAQEMPEPATQGEADLFDALTLIFLEPRQSALARRAVASAVGEANLEILTALLAFIRTAHYWTETHPDLEYEPDMLGLMSQHAELAQLLLNQSEAERTWSPMERARMLAALEERDAQQRLLLRLVQAQREADDPTRIMVIAAEAVGRHLGTSVAGFVVPGEGAVTVSASWPAAGSAAIGSLAASGAGVGIVADLQAGRTLRIADTEADPLTAGLGLAEAGLRALVGVPLLRNGRWQGSFVAGHAGVRHWTDAEVALIQDAGDRTADAAERARAETALRASEEMFRKALEIGTVGIIFFDAAGDITNANDAFLRMSGFSREDQIAGRLRWDAMTPAEWMPASLRAIDELVTLGSTTPYEKEYIRKDGSRFWALFAAKLLGETAGVEFIIDITERKNAEIALQETERRLRTLVEGIPQLVWRAGQAGEWSWVSPQWTAYTGQSTEDSLGDGWLAALHPADRPGALAAWEIAEADGLFEVDYRIRHAKSGSYRWHQTRGIPVHNETGRIAEWLGTSTDIDDQMSARAVLMRGSVELETRVAERTAELEQALATLRDEMRARAQAEEQLRQSEKLKAIGQLTGGIAHDFNNMLQAISSSLSMILTRVQQGRAADVETYVERAQKGAARAAGLTHHLLAFSRQQTLAPKPVSLDRIVRDMEDMIRRTVGPGVQVELQLADGKWLVMCDPNQMESALLNLCVNARDAMPDGGWLTISTQELNLTEADLSGVEDAPPGPYTVLVVSDTGTGMPPDVVAHIFEPFFTTKPIGQGTGLGLSQIYGFVRQSGGFVQVETSPGAGTTVRLLMPFHEINPHSDPGVLPALGRTVLLVEDEPDVRELTAEHLRDFGYRVLEADNAAAALRLVQAGTHIDLLLTDFGLPGGMNGRQLAEAVLQRHVGLPVIVITGYAAGEPMRGMEVLRKPFELAALTDLVKARLDP